MKKKFTKITDLTALLVFEALDSGAVKLEDSVTVSRNAAAMKGSQALLDANAVYSLKDLLRTTIMASAGAQCDHVTHVSTQLPYALTAAGVSCVSYVIAGFVPNALIVLPIAIVLMVATLLVIKAITGRADRKQ